jgi:hypothetical protein
MELEKKSLLVKDICVGIFSDQSDFFPFSTAQN